MPLATSVAHWVQLHPAGPGVEPKGRPGLALAVARASLIGSAKPSIPNPDPLAWEKALRRAPSSGSRLVQTTGRVGIVVTFPQESFGQVARLLRSGYEACL